MQHETGAEEVLFAGSDDCSDTALGREWLSRALHSHAASLSAPSKRDAHSRSQGVLHHQLRLLHADSAVCICNGNYYNSRKSKHLGHQILCCSASGFMNDDEQAKHLAQHQHE